MTTTSKQEAVSREISGPYITADVGLYEVAIGRSRTRETADGPGVAFVVSRGDDRALHTFTVPTKDLARLMDAVGAVLL